MIHFIKVAKISDFKHKRYKCFTYLTKTIAIIKENDGSFYAIEGNCKHQNANLFSKGFQGEIFVCPRHGWKYNIKTGECLTQKWAFLRKHLLKIEGEDIYVSTQAQEK
tara:strand:+ start:428 stop:751 length:324 start_codon:yes stop_codon:yes gene_type:complete